MGQLSDSLKCMDEDDAAYFAFAKIAWDALTPGQREQLKQLLFQGPVYDGSIISKTERDMLITHGLAVRCCFMGEQGYTAATYAAFTLFKEGKGEPMKKKPGTPD